MTRQDRPWSAMKSSRLPMVVVEWETQTVASSSAVSAPATVP